MIAAAIFLCAISFFVSLVFTALVLRYRFALSADVPNQRSLHDRVVPRGGGVVFVLVSLAVWAAVSQAWFHAHATLWYIGPFAAMALVGWMDDRFGLAIWVRLFVQIVVASLAAATLLDAVGINSPWRSPWFFVSVLSIVWVTNLFNFMDGMDGLAASQGALVLAVMGVWFASAGSAPLALFCLILAGAAAGFLAFNWHPAKLFMGDTGSLSLGMIIAVLATGAIVLYDIPALAFVVLMGVFLFDATYTLARRMVRRERWWQSHRGHLYQRAHAAGLSQPRIVGTVIVMNVLLAILASSLLYLGADAFVVTAVAAALLIIAALAVGRCEARSANRHETP